MSEESKEWGMGADGSRVNKFTIFIRLARDTKSEALITRDFAV